MVRVQAKDTGQDIEGAEVIIEVTGQAPAKGVTVTGGMARIFIDISFVNKPGRLIIEATNYKKRVEEIDLIKDALPTVILLEPIGNPKLTEESTPTPTAKPSEEPTATATNTVIPTDTPTFVPFTSTPTSTPTETPTVTSTPTPFEFQIQVKDEDTGHAVVDANVTLQVENQPIFKGKTNANGVAIISIEAVYKGQPGELLIETLGYENYSEMVDLVEEALAEIVLKPKDPQNLRLLPPIGKLAIPLTLDGKFIVYIVDVSGNLLGTVDLARQPDFTPDGTQLIVNGDGGPWDKLRLITQIGDKRGQDIGDPGLGGHSHPFWSPDGMQLIYDDNTIGGGNWRMFIRRDLSQAAGAGEELAARVGPILGQSPLWTDGDWFIFRGCRTWANQGGDCGVWKMQGNQGEPNKLTDNVNHILTDVVGNVVVYNSDEAGGGNWNVYTLNISTGQTNQLTFDPMPESLATLSPDGRWVAYLADQGGQLAVWRVGVNGSTPVKMFDLPRAWGYLTSDGWYNEKLSWGKN
jgi:Tol biopolymer transport system component